MVWPTLGAPATHMIKMCSLEKGRLGALGWAGENRGRNGSANHTTPRERGEYKNKARPKD